MASEKFANNGASTLNGGINNSTTTIIVTSAASFPSAAQFRILIDSEIMLVTAVASTTFTVTRGQEGTTAASHSDLAPVTHILTKGALDQSISDIFQVGTFASLPAVEKAGRVYQCTDFPIRFRDDGSNWIPYYHIVPFTTPSDTGFSWVNQGSSTITTSGYGLYLSAPSNGNGFNVVSRAKSHTSPKKYTAAYIIHSENGNTGGGGLGFRESSTSKFTLNTLWMADYKSYLEHWASNGSISSSFFNGFSLGFLNPYLVWCQVEDDGTNLYWRHSKDGTRWTTFNSHSRTSHMAGGPNQVIFGLNPHNQVLGFNLLSWKEE